MNRRKFIQNSVLTGGLSIMSPWDVMSFASTSKKWLSKFPEVRVPENERNFKSNIIENSIKDFQNNVKNKELGWLFNNCFPNTLDTTVTYTNNNGKPDTYIITGDIDAMWLRDSSAQVWPYMQFAKKDKNIKKLIEGVIHKQTFYINKDPYANAFYENPNKRGEWSTDDTDMVPGVHERKYEIDSLCYPIRLGYHYWKSTGDKIPFDKAWIKAISKTYKVFKNQQKKEGRGPYSFQRNTANATDTRALKGYGYPVNPVGLICSAFRPSDDATVFSFLIPSNFFAVVSLRQAAEMIVELHDDKSFATVLHQLANEVEEALKQHSIIEHPKYGKIYAFEVDGYGNHLMMDDANVPSLLSLPYLGAINADNEIYQNTRKFIWSLDNPFFFRGKAAEGVGSPHVGIEMIWPMSIIMYGLTSQNNEEILKCIKTLKNTHGDTGFMHETFHIDDPNNFTRPWFAWANTLFGEFIWKIYNDKPELLSKI